MKKVIKNALWSLSLTCFLIVGLMSCDPRNTYLTSLNVINGTEQSIYMVDNLEGSPKYKILLPEESYCIFSVAFDDFTNDSPFIKFTNCIKSTGGDVTLYSLDDNSQPKDLLVRWNIGDEKKDHHIFNEDCLTLKYEPGQIYEWTFTILPGDFVPEYSDNGAEQVRQ